MEKAVDKANTGWGLSCVENYLLDLMGSFPGINPESLFYQSGVSYSDIEAIINLNTSYAFYNGISRLQDIAREMGILDMSFLKITDIDTDLINTLFLQYPAILVCVTPEFLHKKYKTTLWRDDHYILLTQRLNDVEFVYHNDVPNDTGRISMDELSRFYNGAIIGMHILRSTSASDNMYSLRKYCEYTAREGQCSLEKDLPEPTVLRDRLGVLKVVRNRLIAFYRFYKRPMDNDELVLDLGKHIQNIDHLFFLSEYYCSRGKDLGEVWAEKINLLRATDKDVCRRIFDALLSMNQARETNTDNGGA